MSRCRSLEKYFKKNPKKIPKLPRSGEVWVSLKNPSVEWKVSGLYRVSDMYSLAMNYPEEHHQTILVTSVNVSENSKTYTSDTLDNFLSQLFFKK